MGKKKSPSSRNAMQLALEDGDRERFASAAKRDGFGTAINQWAVVVLRQAAEDGGAVSLKAEVRELRERLEEARVRLARLES